MNDAIKMQISAFVDGELPANEAELLLRRLGQDAAMRQQVAQYLDIGRAARQERELPGMNALRGHIASSLGDELASAEEEQKVVGSALMTPTTGVAVAATVAALALVGLSQLSGPVDFAAAIHPQSRRFRQRRRTDRHPGAAGNIRRERVVAGSA